MWTIEQTCMNEISILRDGRQVATITNDEGESTADEFNAAQFIADACNAKEAASQNAD